MSDPAKSISKGHFHSLDALRGIAATVVAIGHIGWITSISKTEFVHKSYLMVDFFFVLSGFVIALNYGDRIRNSTQTARFVWLRFWRLYPLHFFMLMVFVGIECAKWYAARHAHLNATQAAFTVNNFRAFVSNLFLVQSFGFNATDTFNAPAWSISAEFYTYLAFAAIVLILGARRYIVGAIGLIAATGWIIFLSGGNLSHSSDLLAFNRCLFGFFLGVMTHAAFKSTSFMQRMGSVSTAITVTIPIALIVALLVIGVPAQQDALAPILSAFVIYTLASSKPNSIKSALDTKPMLWAGDASYSIYMVHMAIIWVFDQIVRVGLHAKTVSVWPGSADLLNISPWLGDLLAIGAIGLSLFVANYTFRFIEVPLRDYSKRAWPASANWPTLTK